MALLFPRIRNEEYCEKLNDPRHRFSFSLWLMKRLQNCEYFTIGGWTAAAAATAAAVFRKQSSWWFRWKEGPLARKHIGKPTGERDIYKGAIGLCRLHSRGCWFASGQVAVPLHLLEQVSCSRVVGERRSGSVTVGYKSRGQIINWPFFPPPLIAFFFLVFFPRRRCVQGRSGRPFRARSRTWFDVVFGWLAPRCTAAFYNQLIIKRKMNLRLHSDWLCMKK